MRPLSIVFVGLSLSSSWGNGHATTYRALLSGLGRLGHEIVFLEREQQWYLANRDLSEPSYCRLQFYQSVAELDAFSSLLAGADAVIVGSYVPDGIEVIDRIAAMRQKLLCFYDIDTPITLARLAEGHESYVARRQLEQFDIYFSFSGGRALDRLHREFGVQRPQPLYCSTDAEVYGPTGEEWCWDLGYLGTYSSDRQASLEEMLLRTARMLPRHRFVVAGSQYPDSTIWPENVERIEHLAPDLHPSFYSRQRYTLNLTRADMIATGWSPSVRLFEASACGTPVISDRWEGLTQLFPEPAAINTASTAQEVASILARDRWAGVEQGYAARRIVLDQHAGLVRAGQLVAMIDEAQHGASVHSVHSLGALHGVAR